MERQDAARPHSLQESDDGRRPPAERAQGGAIPGLYRRRASDALRREMLHQRDEERQVLRLHALLVERQDEGAALRAQEKIRVLDALGDALAGDHFADVVIADEGRELLVTDVRVDRHGAATLRPQLRCGVAW